MNRLNVFDNPYYKWRYPSCWWKNIRMFFRSFKYAWQRITKGYADCDTFNLDSYYLDIFAGTLYHLADNHFAYPGDDRFPNDELWTTYLKEMASCFYRANECNDYYDNPYEDKWYEWLITNKTDDKNPYVEDMMNESIELDKMRNKDLHTGMKMLDDVFFSLWD